MVLAHIVLGAAVVDVEGGKGCEQESNRVLVKHAHDLEALNRGVRRLQHLELAVVGLDDVVEVLHLPVPSLCRTIPSDFSSTMAVALVGSLSVLSTSGCSHTFNPLSALQRNCLGAFALLVDER